LIGSNSTTSTPTHKTTQTYTPICTWHIATQHCCITKNTRQKQSSKQKTFNNHHRMWEDEPIRDQLDLHEQSGLRWRRVKMSFQHLVASPLGRIYTMKNTTWIRVVGECGGCEPTCG